MKFTLIESRVIRILEDGRVVGGRVHHVGGGGQALLGAGVGRSLGQDIWRARGHGRQKDGNDHQRSFTYRSVFQSH